MASWRLLKCELRLVRSRCALQTWLRLLGRCARSRSGSLGLLPKSGLWWFWGCVADPQQQWSYQFSESGGAGPLLFLLRLPRPSIMRLQVWRAFIIAWKHHCRRPEVTSRATWYTPLLLPELARVVKPYIFISLLCLSSSYWVFDRSGRILDAPQTQKLGGLNEGWIGSLLCIHSREWGRRLKPEPAAYSGKGRCRLISNSWLGFKHSSFWSTAGKGFLGPARSARCPSL